MEENIFQHYKDLLGTRMAPAVSFDLINKVGHVFTEELKHLDCQITSKEVKMAVMTMPDEKSSGPDGFPSELFKKFWEIIT